MEIERVTFNPVTALGAQAFAAFAVYVVFTFPTPGDMARMLARPPAEAEVVAVSLTSQGLDPAAAPTDCLTSGRAANPISRPDCLALLTAAVAEIEKAEPHAFDKPAISALSEEVRAAAFRRCRDVWRHDPSAAAMNQSPSCLLVAQDIALPTVMQ